MTLNMTLNNGRNYRVKSIAPGMYYLSPNPEVVCKDGYAVSIQCSSTSYCNPRENFLDVSEYETFELGFPNQSDSLLDDYAENDGSPLTAVYPYVPREIVEALIEKHGGVDFEKSTNA